MAIKRIKVKNFKSFKELDVKLGDLNILIGANASGKSNFVDIFGFLRDIKSFGLDNAISLQGGVEYLRNIRTEPSEILSLEVVSGQKLGSGEGTKKTPTGIRIHETTYKFAIGFYKTSSGFKIIKDEITQRVRFARSEKQENGKGKEIEKTELGKITLSNVKGKIEVDLDLPNGVPTEDDPMLFILGVLSTSEMPPKALFLENPFFRFFASLVTSFVIPQPQSSYRDFSDISIYDFDPKLIKKAASITGKVRLEGDGSNLAIVLKNIIGRRNEKRKLFNLLTYLLPFINGLRVERLADKSLLLKVREAFSEKRYLPASLISDGTINMIALIIALYFEEEPLTIIEEPGRNIHPYLISKVVHMMEDASENKQIVVTTHNPEMVKHAELENILLVSRDELGFSSIYSPSEKEDVRIFLENGLRVKDLYVDSLLETL